MAVDRSSRAQRRAINAIVLGSGERARRIARNLESGSRGRTRVVGFLDDDPSDGDRRALADLYLGRLDRLPEIAASYAVDWVIYGLPRRFLAHDSTANAIGLCETLGIDLTIPVDLFDTRAAHVVRRDVAGLPAISFSVHGRHPVWQFALKRAFDVVGSLLLLALSAPVWLAVALAVKLDSPGPIFFVQPRCGRYGRVFPFLKFRTMVTDAESRKAALRQLNEKSGPVFKMQRDPRVTRVGRILRKYSIDELPQVLNVLIGHMSLVGPRPPQHATGPHLSVAGLGPQRDRVRGLGEARHRVRRALVPAARSTNPARDVPGRDLGPRRELTAISRELHCTATRRRRGRA